GFRFVVRNHSLCGFGGFGKLHLSHSPRFADVPQPLAETRLSVLLSGYRNCDCKVHFSESFLSPLDVTSVLRILPETVIRGQAGSLKRPETCASSLDRF